MTGTYAAFWGAILGCFLMPRLGKHHSLLFRTSVYAYMAALIAAALIAYYFDFERQAQLFLAGMAVQFAVVALLRPVQAYRSPRNRQ